MKTGLAGTIVSRAESPRPRILELSCAVAIAGMSGDTGPPRGSCRSSSSSIYNTTFSATGLLFLMRSTSKQMPRRCNVGSFTSAIKAGSRIHADGSWWPIKGPKFRTEANDIITQGVVAFGFDDARGRVRAPGFTNDKYDLSVTFNNVRGKCNSNGIGHVSRRLIN